MAQTFEGWKAGKDFRKFHWYESCWEAAFAAGQAARDAEIADLRGRMEAATKMVVKTVTCTCESYLCSQPECGEWHERRDKHCAHHNLLAALDAPGKGDSNG